MTEAVLLWRMFPGEIASDLSRYHHRRIQDWHDGTMGSYELLELCEYMDDDGRLKTEMRARGMLISDFLPVSEQRQAVLQIANETAVLRAGQIEGADGDQWGSRLFIPPIIQRDFIEAAAVQADVTESIFSMADRTSNEKEGTL
jgi:hypothetical protein